MHREAEVPADRAPASSGLRLEAAALLVAEDEQGNPAGEDRPELLFGERELVG